MTVDNKIIVHIDPDIAELIPGFLQNRRNDVVTIRKLLEARDFKAIRIIGHSMKGAGGGYGFDPITEYGAAIESSALADEPEGITAAVAQLDAYLGLVEPVFG